MRVRHTGLAGEIAHLVTAGPHGQAMRLIDVFGEPGLRQANSTAIDVDRLLAAATGAGSEAPATRHAPGEAISGALAAVLALTDPELIIVGGSHEISIDPPIRRSHTRCSTDVQHLPEEFAVSTWPTTQIPQMRVQHAGLPSAISKLCYLADDGMREQTTGRRRT